MGSVRLVYPYPPEQGEGVPAFPAGQVVDATNASIWDWDVTLWIAKAEQVAPMFKQVVVQDWPRAVLQVQATGWGVDSSSVEISQWTMSNHVLTLISIPMGGEGNNDGVQSKST